jgi:RNA-directed DNA polymerase
MAYLLLRMGDISTIHCRWGGVGPIRPRFEASEVGWKTWTRAGKINKPQTGRVSGVGLTGWHGIDWNRANGEIRILQEKIVTATLKNNFEEIYKLQRKIVTSFAGRALAVRKVVTNSGSKTAGIDKVRWLGPKDYWAAIQDLKWIVQNPKKYKAKPLLRVNIPKGNTGETRPSGIPTLSDRTVQAVYHLAVDPVVETKSDKNSSGFRKYRSTHECDKKR